MMGFLAVCMFVGWDDSNLAFVDYSGPLVNLHSLLDTFSLSSSFLEQISLSLSAGVKGVKEFRSYEDS
jgi:hypothetical protein